MAPGIDIFLTGGYNGKGIQNSDLTGDLKQWKKKYLRQ